MTAADPRAAPLVELDHDEIRAMLAPVAGAAGRLHVAPVRGGLINTIYRVTTDGDPVGWTLRVYAKGRAACEAETRLLESLAPSLPVPAPLFADATGRHSPHPYLVYRWIEGITLNRCRRGAPADALLALAEPLGDLLARVALTPPPAAIARTLDTAASLARADERLRTGRARARLGDLLAERLRACLTSDAARLTALDHQRSLVHGDLGGRNILVRQDASGAWRVAALLDWESAAAGNALWDPGSLFRYASRYPPEFVRRFTLAYAATGAPLPPDWPPLSRLLDATRLVAILETPEELPRVHAECRGLVEGIA